MREKTPFTIIRATLEHVDEIEGLLYPHYFEESGYNHLDYDSDNCKRCISEWVTSGVGIMIKSRGKLVAFAAMGFIRTFYKQIEADVDMFFVLPEYRGTGIARVLSKVLSDFANEAQAAVVYTSCLSELGGKNNQMYVNLWKKLGFRVLGTVMIRS